MIPFQALRRLSLEKRLMVSCRLNLVISHVKLVYLHTFTYRNGQKAEQDLEDHRFYIQYLNNHHADHGAVSMD